jgi:hypothetical protein
MKNTTNLYIYIYLKNLFSLIKIKLDNCEKLVYLHIIKVEKKSKRKK